MAVENGLEQVALEYVGKGSFSEALTLADERHMRLPTPYEAIVYGRDNPCEPVQNMWTRAVGITQHSGGMDSSLCGDAKTASLKAGIYCLRDNPNSKLIREMVESGRYEFPTAVNCDISRARAEISQMVGYVRPGRNDKESNQELFISLFGDKIREVVHYFFSQGKLDYPKISLEGISRNIGTPRIVPLTINATLDDNFVTFHDEEIDRATERIVRKNVQGSIYLKKD